jgi:hypothetical protein
MADADTCLNCGAPGAREYCGECGQRHVPADQLSVRTVWGEYLENGLRELRLPHTLWTLFRHPGQLTVDYAEGKRLSQANPIVLFLTLVGLSGILHAGADLAQGLRAIEVDDFPAAEAFLRAGIEVVSDPDVSRWIIQFLNVYFAVVPGLVVVLAAYGLLRRDLLRAAVFALHLAIVNLILEPIGAVPTLLGGSAVSVASLVGPLVITPIVVAYAAFAARRVYGVGWGVAGMLAGVWLASGLVAAAGLVVSSGFVGLFLGLGWVALHGT